METVKISCYLKIAKTKQGKYKFAVTKKPTAKPLDDGSPYMKEYYPTVCLRINFTAPKTLFDKADNELSLSINEKNAKILATVGEEDEKENV